MRLWAFVAVLSCSARAAAPAPDLAADAASLRTAASGLRRGLPAHGASRRLKEAALDLADWETRAGAGRAPGLRERLSELQDRLDSSARGERGELAADIDAAAARIDALAMPALPTPAAGSPARERAAALEAAQARVASVEGALAGGFDGQAARAPSSAVPDAPPAVAAPRPPAVLRRQAVPRYDPRVAEMQAQLDVVRRNEGLRGIASDGFFGPGTERAVAQFQRLFGLRPTGVVDERTRSVLLVEYQALNGLSVTGRRDLGTERALAQDRSRSDASAGRYFQGSDADFAYTPHLVVVRRALATVYTPYLDQTAAERRREGPPVDRFMQTVCTLERFLAGRCPYVSVAIDRNLDIPDGTPLLIPGIDRIAGRRVLFRVVDTGARRYFHGSGHIDVATDSDEYSGLGSLITGREFELIFPRGLRPRRP